MVCAGVLALLHPSALPAQGEPREPGPGAKPHTVYEAKSKGGLRYTWAIPAESPPAGERALTVLLHGTGLDCRWGLANHTVGKFRPHDVLVSVDGTSPGRNGTRLFLESKDDLTAFGEFLKELRQSFAVDRVLLYGHRQGGFFVALYAGAHPEDVAGVVAHASGAWASAAMPLRSTSSSTSFELVRLGRSGRNEFVTQAPTVQGGGESVR